MKTPRSVDVGITNNCNLRCGYCYHFESAGDVSEDLPLSDWLQFFEELGENSVMDVNLGGGEALLREDLPAIIEGIVKNRMRFSLLTNGTLMTDDFAAFLANTGRCNVVQVSLDGSNAQIHDSFRGQGTFDKVIKGINILKKHKLPVTIRVTLHKKNLTDLNNLTRMLVMELGMPGYSINSVYYSGLCSKNFNDIALNTEDRTTAIKTLSELDREYKGRIKGTSGPLIQARDWVKILKLKKDGSEGIPGGGYLTACNGVFLKLSIRADGVIIPCNQLAHIELGKINQQSLRSIWEKHTELQRLRDRKKISLQTLKFCKTCEYVNFCTGSCPGVAYNITGKDDHPNPDDCLKKFLEDGGKLPDG